jgi:hypothetical protein
MTEEEEWPKTDLKPRERWWYRALNMFPFIYLPIVLLIALACAILLPILRRMAP